MRNRKTKETFTPEQGCLTSSSLFAKKTDTSQFNDFINEFAYSLPNHISTNDRQKLIINLRKKYSESAEIKEIDKNPHEFKRLIQELKHQIKNLDGEKSDAASITNFVSIIGSSLINAQLNGIFPGLAVFTSLFGAAAANGYSYFQGMPQGGEDLCDKALGECIQGYLTELNMSWTPDMPQIARDFVGTANDSTACITHNDMEAMLRRGFRPNNDTINCTISNIVETSGNASVTATNLDQIGCNLLEDSTVGMAKKCGETFSGLDPFTITEIAAGGTVALMLIGYAAYKCCAVQRQEREYERINEITSIV